MKRGARSAELRASDLAHEAIAGRTVTAPELTRVRSTESTAPRSRARGSGASSHRYSGQSWREFADRPWGPDTYRLGDITRGLFRRVATNPARLHFSHPPLPEGSGSGSDAESDPSVPGRARSESPPRRSQPFGAEVGHAHLPGLVRWLLERRPRAAREATLTPLEVSLLDLDPVGPRFRPIFDLCLLRARGAGARAKAVPEQAILGEGTYGKGWRARQRRTGRIFAVKNINAREASMAEREVEIAERVLLGPHPCVVRLFDVHQFPDDDLCCLVMEFCGGGDLYGKIKAARKRVGPAAYVEEGLPEDAHFWIGQVFLGLEHLHLKMHTLLRDVKPENIVFADGRAKITDFGFGRLGLQSAGGWTFGIPTGTPGYCAPEIILQRPYDHRADLYSFGVLTWVILTGGVINRRKVEPPMGEMRHANDFNVFAEDWSLLARALAEPRSHHANPLAPDARDFVGQLTKRQPDQRLEHSQIRSHPFVQSLALPPADLAYDDIAAWKWKHS